MKWLFFLLVILNLVVFIWGFQNEPPAPVGADHPTPGVKRLELFSEQKSTVPPAEAVASGTPDEENTPSEANDHQIAEAGETSAADAEAPAAPVGESMEFIGMVGEKRPEPFDPDALPPTAAGKTEQQTEPTTGNTTMKAASAVAEVLPPSQGPAQESRGPDSSIPSTAVEDTPPPVSIQPAGEEGSASNGTETPTAQAESPPAKRCLSLGPMLDQAEVGALEKALARYPVDSRLRTEMIAKAGSGYSVVVPPLPTKEEALAEERRLREAGYKDLYRFHKGRMANAISLGFFSKEALAKKLAERMQAKGFEVQVRPRKVARTVYWLDLILSAETPTDTQLEHDVLADHPAVKLEHRACPTSAVDY